ncbi:MAG: glycosyltransferase [Candidatus Protochlamydia sp.]|nr:glycosyltransferase [Candidatus Protochlamydia sp.]
MKILIYTTNVVGKSMAGPAIRCWEFAKALSASHEVALIGPIEPDIQGDGFQVLSKSDAALQGLMRSSQVLITQNLTLSMALKAKNNGLRIIIDAYDPLPLEIFELFKHDPEAIRQERLQSSINQLIFNFKMADGILCASEKQRDLWIGFLLGLKLLTFEKYDYDNSLRQIIDVVPFGLSKNKPEKSGPGLREKYGFSAKDKILLWGGGIWNWFDPLSIIRAVARLSQERPEIKLVFLGIKSPDPTVPEMAMCTKAIQLAKELGVINNVVYFNEGWIPYGERHNYLLDADIGVSTHFDHLETRYSFRTRMLDYIWAELPILATAGDSFADLIEQHNLGIVVPYQDERGIEHAILNIIDCPDKVKQIKTNLVKISEQFYWDSVVKPIEKMISQFSHQNSSISFCTLKSLAAFFVMQVKEKGLIQSAKLFFSKLRNRFLSR